MSDTTPVAGAAADENSASFDIQEVRYSYKAMMQEVVQERKHSVMGRELIDAAEISQIFEKRKRKIKKL